MLGVIKMDKSAKTQKIIEENKKIISKAHHGSRPENEVRCISCPHALWGNQREGLSCKCKIMYAITFDNKITHGVIACSGMEDKIEKGDKESSIAKSLPCWTCKKALWYRRGRKTVVHKRVAYIDQLYCYCADWLALVYGVDSHNKEIPVFVDCAGYEFDPEIN